MVLVCMCDCTSERRGFRTGRRGQHRVANVDQKCVKKLREREGTGFGVKNVVEIIKIYAF